ncbi:hypothetical protein [Pleurocapsa sp. FMAR1]|uniref:hypothetical protein n=1 Tax=Pleurocapsa sp. FMAR1 TaxID=3040204 RepID=UPI0029C90C05|nr:hypothetical protein [Pleurocapsa sp. FMAR1]
MPDNNHRHLPKMLRQGKVNRSQEAKPPQTIGASGSIMTNLQDINWTPKKLGLVIAALTIPYLIAVIAVIQAGNVLVGSILIGLALFVGLVYLALRWIDKSDF